MNTNADLPARKINRRKLTGFAIKASENTALAPADALILGKWLANDGELIETAPDSELGEFAAFLKPIYERMEPPVVCGQEGYALVEALTGDKATPCTFQTFDDSKANGKPGREGLNRVFNGTLSELEPPLRELNNEGAGIFITVNETNLKGRKISDIINVRAMIADFDSDDAMALADAAAEKLPPSIVVESSPGKRHLYWLLEAGEVPADKYKPLAKALIAAVGSDPSANDLARVLRVPGFMHKKGEPVMVKLLSANPERRYTKAQIVEAFGLDTSAESTVAQGGSEGALAGDNWNLRLPLHAQQLADINQMIDEAKVKGLHHSKAGHEQLWSGLALAFCMVPGGDALFIRFSEGGVEFDKAKCLLKLEEKRKAIKRNACIETGIAGAIRLLMDNGIANPATGRSRKAGLAVNGEFKQPPLGFNLTTFFADHTITNEDAHKMLNTTFAYPNLIPKGSITVYPSPPGGGKTAIFTHAACVMAKTGLKVMYINADASPSQLKDQQVKADKYGFSILAPDAKNAGGVPGIMKKLQELAAYEISLSDVVIVVDTLKKFVNMLSKDDLKNFLNLLRTLVAKGATACLLAHTNKYPDKDGNLIYEGTGDIRADVDNMIYIYSSLAAPGVREATTAPDKTRAMFEPISFVVRFGEWGVSAEEVDEVFPCLTDELRGVLNAVTKAIKSGIRSGEAVVQFVEDELMLGRNKAREKVKQLIELKNSPVLRKASGNGFRFSLANDPPEPIADFDEVAAEIAEDTGR
jgi:hypothetical protein